MLLAALFACICYFCDCYCCIDSTCCYLGTLKKSSVRVKGILSY